MIFTGLFLFVRQSQAATYYVSLSGNDSNAGTIDQPWASINRATHNVVAGDTIYIRGGAYPTVQYGYQFGPEAVLRFYPDNSGFW